MSPPDKMSTQGVAMELSAKLMASQQVREELRRQCGLGWSPRVRQVQPVGTPARAAQSPSQDHTKHSKAVGSELGVRLEQRG